MRACTHVCQSGLQLIPLQTNSRASVHRAKLSGYASQLRAILAGPPRCACCKAAAMSHNHWLL